MTVLTSFSSAADGHVQSTNATYATARTGGTLAADTTATTRFIGQAEFFGYFCNEVFFDFDTSALGSGATISSAILSLFGNTDSTTTDCTFEARIDNWGGTVTTADWVSGASLSGFTLVATYATSGGWSTSGYNNFTDVAMIANVAKTGTTWIMVSSDRHRLGTSPGVSGSEQASCYMANQAGTTNDPKLVVTYTAGLSGTAGTATETDTAVALGRSKTKAIVTVTETETAMAITHNKSKTITAAVETNVAPAVGRNKSRAVVTATETDTAVNIAWAPKRRLLGIATEVNAALSITRNKRKLIGIASETDTALTVTRGPHGATVAPAVETDTAPALGRSKTKSVTLAGETDTAPSVAARKSRTLSVATETDSALALGATKKAKAITAAVEADSAVTISPRKARAITPASETDSALAITRANPHVVLIGTATETDTAPSIPHTGGLAALSDLLHWRRMKKLRSWNSGSTRRHD